MADERDYIGKVYDELKGHLSGFTIDEKTFRGNMQDESYIKQVYQELSNPKYFPGFNESEANFLAQFTPKKKVSSAPLVMSGASFAPVPGMGKYQRAKDAIDADIAIADNAVGTFLGELTKGVTTGGAKALKMASETSDYLASLALGEGVANVGSVLSPIMMPVTDASREVLSKSRAEDISKIGDTANIFTSKEYEKDLANQAEENGILSGAFVEQSIGSLGRSMGEIAGSGGSAGFALSMMNDAKTSAKEAGLSEGESIAFGATVGMVVSALEKYGMDQILKASIPKVYRDKASKWLAATVIKKLGKQGGEITEEVIEQAIDAEVKSLKGRVAAVGAKGIFNAGSEGGTEVLQEGFTIGTEQLVNSLKGEKLFQDEDFQGRLVKSFAGGLYGGASVGSIVGAAKGSEAGNYVSEKVQETYKNPEAYNAFRGDLAETLIEKGVPETEVEVVLNKVDKMRERQLLIPESAQNRTEVSKLIEKKEELLNEISTLEVDDIDTAFQEQNNKAKKVKEEQLAAINDSIIATSNGGKIEYRKIDGTKFEKVVDGKTEKITEAQYNYAKNNKLDNISFRDLQTKPKPLAVDKVQVAEGFWDVEMPGDLEIDIEMADGNKKKVKAATAVKDLRKRFEGAEKVLECLTK